MNSGRGDLAGDGGSKGQHLRPVAFELGGGGQGRATRRRRRALHTAIPSLLVLERTELTIRRAF